MAKISKYLKLDKDILLEYIYDDGNLIAEKYKILLDSRDRRQSYIGDSDGTTGNTAANQLFRLDSISGKFAVVDPSYYSYLQYKEYSSGIPVRHDTIKIHTPVNWTFGEHLGFYIKVYTFDRTTSTTFELSNFYFDMTNTNQSYLLNYTTPPLFFQEKLWGKNISVEIPAISEVSAQISGDFPKENTINYNLTNGVGLNTSSPIFIDFYFVDGIQTINGRTSYILGPKTTTTVPQTPEFERLGLKIEHSSNGDFFEIYGTYNDNIAEFKKFIDDSIKDGHRYYVQYDIITFEQNIRGKTTTVTVHDSFNETVEYRPIIKFSTTTAIIDVEMRLIDSVDDSFLLRRASYGMLQDEVSKYSMNMTKINLVNASKPKIYNIKTNIDASLLGKTNSMGRTTTPTGRIFNGYSGKGYKNGISISKGKDNQTTGGGAGGGTGGGNNGGGNGLGGNGVQTVEVKVPYPVLIDRFNIIAKSDNAVINNNTFYGIGKIRILIYPFDNIVKFIIAMGTNNQPDYLDLSGFNEVKMVIKNDANSYDFPLLTSSGEIDLKMGQVVFKIPESKFLNVKKIYDGGVNLFYIIGSNGTNNNVIYTGLFRIYDSLDNIDIINNEAPKEPNINQDPKLPKETAIVTRKLVTSQTIPTKKP
jgi:ASC-1-like (ASCH) protein